jgi:hypothetical protein
MAEQVLNALIWERLRQIGERPVGQEGTRLLSYRKASQAEAFLVKRKATQSAVRSASYLALE